MSLVTNAQYLYYLNVGQSETITNNLTPIISAAEQKVKEYLHRDLEWTAYSSEYYDGNGKSKLVLRQFPIIYVASIYEYNGITSGNVEDWDLLVEHTDYDRLVVPQEAHYVYLDGYTFAENIQNYKITYYAGYTAGDTLVSGDVTLGKKYRIATRSIVDFTAIGASANTVGTQFVATSTGVTLSAVDSVTELVTLPEDIKLACKELVALYWNTSPMKNNWIGLQTASNNAGSATQNLTLDTEAEMKILKRIEHHRAINV